MTLEEALKIIDSYTARERATHDKIYSAYLRNREKLKDSTANVTYEMVRAEYGGGSMGTVAKYLPPILTVERAKERAESKGSAANETSAPKPVPDGVQKKLDAARAVLDAMTPAIVEASALRDAELATSYQRMLDEQKAALLADLNDIQARQAEQESFAVGAGKEAEALQWQLEDLRATHESVTAERDSDRAKLAKLTAEHELVGTQLTAAQAQIATHVRAEERYSAELDRLLGEREPLLRDAERGREAKAELDRLRRRLDDAEARKRELSDDLRTLRARETAAQEKHDEEVRALRQCITVLDVQLTRALELAVSGEGK